MKASYFLLPFTFSSFNVDKEILVNFVGDFLIVDKGTSKKIAEKKIKKNNKIYKDLVSNFIICESNPLGLIDILSARYRTKKHFLEDFTSLHIFVLTLRCNQSCLYCQVSSTNSILSCYDITYKNLKLAVEKMFMSPSHYLTMEFQGGEPLLVFERIKYAVELAEQMNNEHKRNLRFVICSNGVLLNEEILMFMKEHEIYLSTSLDGPSFVHNKGRKYKGKDSYLSTIKGLELAKNILGIENISALMTTTSYSLKYPEDIIVEYLHLGFNSIFLREINPYGFSINSTLAKYSSDDFFGFYKRAFEYILEINKSGRIFIEDFAAIILRKILTPFSSCFVDMQSPTGIISSVIVYNYDGYVYASDESRMMAEKGEYFFRLGKISDKYEEIFFNKKVKEIALHWTNECLAGCSDCCYQLYCGADPVRNYMFMKDLEGFRPTSEFCNKNKKIIEYLIEKSLNPVNYRIFQDWLQ